MPNTINVVSSNPIHGEVWAIQHYVIKFVSTLRQVGGFLRYGVNEHDHDGLSIDEEFSAMLVLGNNVFILGF